MFRIIQILNSIQKVPLPEPPGQCACGRERRRRRPRVTPCTYLAKKFPLRWAVLKSKQGTGRLFQVEEDRHYCQNHLPHHLRHLQSLLLDLLPLGGAQVTETGNKVISDNEEASIERREATKWFHSKVTKKVILAKRKQSSERSLKPKAAKEIWSLRSGVVFVLFKYKTTKLAKSPFHTQTLVRTIHSESWIPWIPESVNNFKFSAKRLSDNPECVWNKCQEVLKSVAEKPQNAD